jgi:aromatase
VTDSLTDSVTDQGHREVEHRIVVDAPANEVYLLIADVRNWPQLFSPTVYVDHIERSAGSERIRIWATANGEVKTWVSRRVLDADAHRIEFRQEVSAPPVAAMGGTWLIEPAPAGGSLVRLRHDYRAVDDDPRHLEWIDQAVDRNSRVELAALKTSVETVTAGGDGSMFSFADTVTVDGAAGDVYDFLNDAQWWADRLPHVSRVVLTEDTPGLQILEMDTRTKDGSTHTTKSVRVCFPHQRIVYKQITLPALITLHTGYWQIQDDPAGGGLSVTAQHTVVINPANVTQVLGAGAGLAEAREFVHRALSANSTATLGHAKDHAEKQR